MAFYHSILINRALKPARHAIGEGIADFSGATGAERTRIVANTRRIVEIGGSVALSTAMADPGGAGFSAADALS